MLEVFGFSAYAITGAGKVRLCNQDSYCIGEKVRRSFSPETETLFEKHFGEEFICAVFDGMGGEKSGDVASFLCARALQECISQKNGKYDIDAYITRANSLVCELSKEISAHCGTTLAILYITDGFAHIYNIGDSRIYHLSDGILKQLSVDHTAAQSLVNIGVLTKEEARHDSRRHTLIRHIGIPEEEMLPEPHHEKVKIKSGDTFLLCTDGVTESLEDHEIWEIISSHKEAEDTAYGLYDAALNCGGKDNITAIIVKIL